MSDGPDLNDPRFARDHSLVTERHKVAALMAMLEAQGFGDDEELILDAIEGETDALEAVSKVLRLIGEDGARAEALKALEGDYAARRRRYEERVKFARMSLMNFMQEFGLKKIERPEATLTRRDGGQKIAYAPDFDPKNLPESLVKVSIDADKAKIKAFIEENPFAVLPGVYLTNGEPTLTVRVK